MNTFRTFRIQFVDSDLEAIISSQVQYHEIQCDLPTDHPFSASTSTCSTAKHAPLLQEAIPFLILIREVDGDYALNRRAEDLTWLDLKVTRLLGEGSWGFCIL
jgi:hypothetical protein